MRRGLRGHDYVTVLRPQGERDRGGDLPPSSEHTAGPCMIDWSPTIAGFSEVKEIPIEANRREVWLYFREAPDIVSTDSVRLENGITYRVITVEEWKWQSRNTLAGVVVKIAGLE